jgi:hypothetical protein
MAIIPKPQFPNVPKLPGVPQLLRSGNFPANPGPVLGAAVAVGRLWRALFSTPKWGVYKQTPPPTTPADDIPTVTVRSNLQPVIIPDSVLDFGARGDYETSDYPVQDGAFASYNKVANPNETSVRLYKSGSVSDRERFLAQIDAIMPSLELFYILTPERRYIDVNPYRYEIVRRGGSGAYQLEVDLYFREVRRITAQYTQTATATLNAQNPSAEPVQNTGNVQVEEATNDADIEKIMAAVDALPDRVTP